MIIFKYGKRDGSEHQENGQSCDAKNRRRPRSEKWFPPRRFDWRVRLLVRHTKGACLRKKRTDRPERERLGLTIQVNRSRNHRGCSDPSGELRRRPCCRHDGHFPPARLNFPTHPASGADPDLLADSHSFYYRPSIDPPVAASGEATGRFGQNQGFPDGLQYMSE